MISWSTFLEKVIDDFEIKGYTFDHIAEMQIVTMANKLDTSYDFNIRHNAHAVERKLNMIIAKNSHLINKLDRSKRHPLIRKTSLVQINK